MTGDRVMVLVVDDDAAAAEAIAEQVRELGHRVVVAHDAATAVQSAASHPPDVVLTDIFMADMDGIELIRAIRSNRIEMTIIAMSGGSTDGYDVLGISQKFGADAAISKPFRRDELGQVIDRCLGRSPKPESS
jgi:CheY-like chemotaxis protein